MEKTLIIQQPSGARIINLKSRDEVTDFIKKKELLGFLSSSIYRLDGSIDVRLNHKDGRAYNGHFINN